MSTEKQNFEITAAVKRDAQGRTDPSLISWTYRNLRNMLWDDHDDVDAMWQPTVGVYVGILLRHEGKYFVK